MATTITQDCFPQLTGYESNLGILESFRDLILLPELLERFSNRISSLQKKPVGKKEPTKKNTEYAKWDDKQRGGQDTKKYLQNGTKVNTFDATLLLAEAKCREPNPMEFARNDPKNSPATR